MVLAIEDWNSIISVESEEHNICWKSLSGLVMEGISLIEYTNEFETEIPQSPLTVVVIT